MAQIATSARSSAAASDDRPWATSSSFEYEPRAPEDSAVHQIVVEHLETFLDEARTLDGGRGVPGFVERSLRKLVECGSLGKGFARIRCSECGFERLLPFSCKVRGLCSSCAGRRMTEMSAHLVDSVLRAMSFEL